MTIATLHDVRSVIQLRLDKRVVVTFPYEGASQRKTQLEAAEAYIKKAIKEGAAIKLKPGVEKS